MIAPKTKAPARGGSLGNRRGSTEQAANCEQYSSIAEHVRNVRHALAYAGRGMQVFPVNGKRPLIHDWPNRASTDKHIIRDWWSAWPDAGIGVVTGPVSGVLVLDLDTPEAVQHVAEIGAPTTPVVKTPRGWHLWYRFPDGFEHSTTRANVLAVPGGDTRGAGGFVVAPPSPHAEGIYSWARSLSDHPLADPPDWLIDALTPAQTAQCSGPAPEVRCADRYALAALQGECAELANTSAGGRNHRLNTAAFKLARFVTSGTLSADDVTASLTDAAIRAGLPQNEIVPTLSSGLRAGMEVSAHG